MQEDDHVQCEVGVSQSSIDVRVPVKEVIGTVRACGCLKIQAQHQDKLKSTRCNTCDPSDEYLAEKAVAHQRQLDKQVRLINLTDECDQIVDWLRADYKAKHSTQQGQSSPIAECNRAWADIQIDARRYHLEPALKNEAIDNVNVVWRHCGCVSLEMVNIRGQSQQLLLLPIAECEQVKASSAAQLEDVKYIVHSNLCDRCMVCWVKTSSVNYYRDDIHYIAHCDDHKLKPGNRSANHYQFMETEVMFRRRMREEAEASAKATQILDNIKPEDFN